MSFQWKTAVLSLCLAGGFAAGAMAQGKAAPQLTTEQREQMAGVHEKAAACLRSDRPVSECRADLMKGCQEAMGKDGCPMMGGMGRGKQRGARMMQPGPAKGSPQQSPAQDLTK